MEEALYSAVRALEGKGAVLRRIAEHFHGNPAMNLQYRERAQALDHSADVLREVLTGKAL